ncbi:MAG TPA: glycosyl hydrolase family 18 protein [Acidimicrobiales bacterium]|nr:glycosyl hydrolase family 18 protein [Acidimicrobiales bacterium]
MSPYAPYSAAEQRAVRAALADVHVTLPTRPGAPAPDLPARPFGAGLGSHVVLGFLPSWEIAAAATVDYAALSEVAYYAVVVRSGGRLLRSGQGWDDLVNGDVAPVVSAAHAAGTRVLLTVSSVSESVLARLAADPASGRRLAGTVAQLMRADGFDGVDLDLEGQLASARAGFVRFMAAFSSRLRALEPSTTIVLNTLPQSAVDEEGFFDVRALAPFVDQFFVMAYDMSDLRSPGPTAPLVGAELCDASSLASYVATVPASKVILGIPFYGYDFTLSRSGRAAGTVGEPEAVSYDQVLAAGRPAAWDPSTETPYISFRDKGRWHETWYDNPLSVALKVALAAAFRTAGVGAWELGMASGQDEMTVLLDGGSPPLRPGGAPAS